jgi:AraC-like DNA-binding protein
MTFNTYLPPNQLASVVRYYWSLDGELSPTEKYIHRTLANHCPELIFHYGGEFKEIVSCNKIEKTFRTGLHGQTNIIRRFTAENCCGIFGVMLEPYAVPILFNSSATDVKNELVDLELFIGGKGKEIAEQMVLAKNNIHRVSLMNHFLTKRLTTINSAQIIYAVKSICSENGNVNIRHIAKRACLSQRQFERNFKNFVGFTPKTFARIVRFKSLVDNYTRTGQTLTEIAYDFGYYDQSHFIHDFKQFSGYNPKTYFHDGANEVFYAPQ